MLNIQFNTREKLNKPNTQPTANKANVAISRFLIAVRIGVYMPKSNRIKLPDMPGKIIAQMANIPDKNTNKLVGSIALGGIMVIK